jgi:hypothetical protein
MRRGGCNLRSPKLEAITRLVADSLARHGLDRPVDPRRLQWSRWFRCDSPHSLLVVPSKPGIFALSEEIMDLGPGNSGAPSMDREGHDREGHDFSSEPALSKRSAPKGAVTPTRNSPALAAEGTTDGNHRADATRRMLAVLQFSEDDDMAFTLDRMFTCVNPMRARLSSGRCFLRFVVIEDQAQRRSICNALNQWLLSSAEKTTGMTTDFQSSLEFGTANVGTSRVGTDAFVRPASEASAPPGALHPAPHLDSGAAKNLHCPHPLPSGF